MLEIFEYNPQKYGGMVLVDIVVANIWMADSIWDWKEKSINKWLKADTSAIEELKEKVTSFSNSTKRIPNLTDYMIF